MSDTAITGNLHSAQGAKQVRASLRRANRGLRIKALLLVVPMLLFLFVAFLVPLADMLFRSVENDTIIQVFPKTVEALADWEGNDIPSEQVFAIFAAEMQVGKKNRTLGRVGKRLNYEEAGIRSVFNSTARKLKNAAPPYKEFFIETNEKWGNIETWKLLRLHSPRYSLSYFLAALDLRYTPDGEITPQPELNQIYIKIFVRTIVVSLSITFICLLLGYPIAYLLSTLPVRTSNLLLILVLLPFWTSLLVRTTSWIALLQSQGIINDLLVFIGFIDDEARLSMIYNMTGTIIAMVHILLPFMVLPLFSVMKTIPPSYMRAARSLGGKPFYSFIKIYWPQTITGIGAGSVLVFIIAIGYYITPALVGGRTGQLISNLIAYHMQQSLNWGLAAALGSLLLILVLIFYWLYNRLIGIDKIKLG